MNGRDRTRTIFIVIIAATIVVITAIVIYNYIKNDGGEKETPTPDVSSSTSSPSSNGPTNILILTADTKAEWVETVTEIFNAEKHTTSSGSQIQVTVQEQDSPGDARDALLAGQIQPEIWSPGDYSWVEQANQVWQDMGRGSLVTGECPRTVYAATGFAMWQPMAEAMGWPDTPIGWDEIINLAADPEGWSRYGHPEWGQFKFGHTHPEHSTTGFALLANLAYAAVDRTTGLTPELVKSDQVMEAFRTLEANTYHYGSSTKDLMNLMATNGPSYLHALSGSETAVLANNVHVPEKRFPYVFIFPKEGVYWSDNPFCILETDWVTEEEREAALIYRDYLLAPEQQDIAIEIGLRPAKPDFPLHCPICLEFFTDPRVTQANIPALAAVDDEVHSAIVDVFEQTKRKATIVVVLDRSQSMSEGKKLVAAVDGIKFFLDLLRRDDEILVMPFSDDVIPLQPLARAGESVESLKQQLTTMWAEGNTVLNDAICAAQEVIDAARDEDETSGEKRLYGIIVLSDGDDTNSERTESDMLRCLPGGEAVEGTKVFTIAYGDEANKGLLERIAIRTNGKFFEGNPENIDEIYLAISTEQ